MSHPHGHHHHAGCECGHEARVSEQDLGVSLYSDIDTEHVRCLNELEEGMGVRCIKPYQDRLDDTEYLESNEDDPELILFIPFTSNVQLRSICVVGGRDGMAPLRAALFINREDIDFTNVRDLKPAQELNLAEDFDASIDYPLRPHRFLNVFCLTIFFEGCHGGDSTRIDYLGLKGKASDDKRTKAVEFVYEARANVKDHRTPQEDGSHQNVE